MSVTHPLLKELKGHVFDLRKCSQVTEICDYHPTLVPLCCTLESIFREGLKASCATAFGITKKDYWFWICLIYEQRGRNNIPFSLCDAIEYSKDCEKVYSSIGKGRLFIRTVLAKKLLQLLLTCFVEDKLLVCSTYDPVSSILGNEILVEILSSLLYELSKIDFKLELKNASFLDETWNLGVYRKYEFVPCKEMGITFGCIQGRIIVVKVEDGSVAAEENQVEVGDVLDELFGHSLYKCKKGLIQSLAHQFQGLPVYLSVVKCCTNGKIYTPLLPILDKLHLQEIIKRNISHSLVNESTGNKLNTNQNGSPSDGGSSSLSSSSLQFELILLGKIFMGKEGNVTQVEKAIAKAIEQSKDAKNIIMEICETKLKVYEKSAGEVMVVKHFTEISACGRKASCPETFAVICGDTTCTFAEEFHCYVFQAGCDEEARTILSSIAQGFGRTHWAV